jgi:hypothetical protein
VAYRSKFISGQEFDPFQDRLCRDIRNQLSKNFIQAIDSGDIGPLKTVAGQFIEQGLKPYMRDYIESRVKRYQAIINQAKSSQNQARYMIALLFWNNELFFEFHELLEKEWLRATGTEKLVLQALIRAAGTYMLLNHGRMHGATKMAAKAVAGLKQHKESVPACFDADLLITKLSALDPIPPKF